MPAFAERSEALGHRKEGSGAKIVLVGMQRLLHAVPRTLTTFVMTMLWMSPVSLVAQETATAPLLTVDQAIQIAIANNRGLKITSLDIDKSKWQIAEAKTNRFPVIKTYIFAAGNLNSPTFDFKEGTFGTIGSTPVPQENTTIPLSSGIGGSQLSQISQPISQLYKINLGIHAQQLGFDYANQEYRAKRQSLVADVKQSYYSVLQSESALEAAQTSVTQYEETDRVALQYVAQEAILKSDSLDVKAKLAQAKYQVIHLNNELQTRKEQLNDLLARDLTTDFHTQAVPPASFQEIDLTAARQTALNKRPEVAEADINVKKAMYDRKLAQAQYIPDVSASLHYYSSFTAEILPPNIVSAGVEFNWEPFDWGRRHDVVKQKEVVVDQSHLQLDQVRSQVLQDVDNRFRSLQESRAALEVAQAARDASTEKLREVNDKFGKEAILLRDVLQQQTAVADANHDYEQALLSFWTAKANFEKALGEE
jgi:outer membrane protein